MISTAHKSHWLILLLACLLMFGNYYAYDVPGSIASSLNKWLDAPEDVFSYELNLLYTIYSLPNIFLPLVGGILVDKLGSSAMLIVFSTLICIGQTVFALGMNARDFKTMLIGRALFGLGGESLEVAQASITTDWFHDHGLAFALGCFARIAAALNDNLSPWIAEYLSVGVAGWIGAGTCYFSAIIGIILLQVDKKEYRIAAGVEVNDLDTQDSNCNIDSNYGGEEAVVTSDISGYESEEYDEEDDKIHFSQARGFTFQFWILFLITILLYGSVQPFFHICTAYFQSGRWPDMTPRRAGFAMSVPDIIAAIGTPIMGYLTDRYGYRTHLIIVSGLCILLSLSLMTFTTLSPVASMSLLGVAYSVFTSSLWPCVPFLVERHQTATAYGLLSVALNLTLSVVPIIIATLRSRYPLDWNYALFFFLSLSLASILFSIWFFMIDRSNGGMLARSVYVKVDQGSIIGDEAQPLLESDLLSVKTDDKEEYVAKVIAEGIVLSVPRVVIHHHHKIPNHSKEKHFHTTHCKCFDDLKLQKSNNTRTGKLSGKRKRSPVRRHFHSENIVTGPDASISFDESPISIAASI